jgi:hypothetical protein
MRKNQPLSLTAPPTMQEAKQRCLPFSSNIPTEKNKHKTHQYQMTKTKKIAESNQQWLQ